MGHSYLLTLNCLQKFLNKMIFFTVTVTCVLAIGDAMPRQAAFQSRLEKKARAADVPDPSFRENISTILNQNGEIDQKVTELKDFQYLLKAENEELKAKLNEASMISPLRRMAQDMESHNLTHAIEAWTSHVQGELTGLKSSVTQLQSKVNYLESIIPPRRTRLNGPSGIDDPTGRVEVWMYGEWGTVCDDRIDENNNGANVICKSLGYASRTKTSRPSNIEELTSGPIWLDDVVCDGTEASILDCSRIPVDPRIDYEDCFI